MTKYENDIRFCGKKLESTSDKEVIVKYLGKLSKYRMTCELLKSTNIATLVRNLQRKEGEIGAKASELMRKWMDVVTKTQQTSLGESRPKDGKPKSSIKVNVELVGKKDKWKDSSRSGEKINRHASSSDTSDNKYSNEYDPEYTEPRSSPRDNHVSNEYDPEYTEPHYSPKDNHVSNEYDPEYTEPHYSPRDNHVITEPDFETPSLRHVEDEDPPSVELEASFSPDEDSNFDDNYEEYNRFDELDMKQSVASKHKLEPHDRSPCEPTRKKTKIERDDIDYELESLDEYKYKKEAVKKEHHKSHSKSHSKHKTGVDLSHGGDIELRLEPSKRLENVQNSKLSKESTNSTKTLKETYKSSKHEHHHKSKTNEKYKSTKEEKHRDSNSEKKTDKHSKSKEDKHSVSKLDKKTHDKHSKSSKAEKHRDSSSEKKLSDNVCIKTHNADDLVKIGKSVNKDKHHKSKSHKEEKHKHRNADEKSELLIKTKKHEDKSERKFSEKIQKKEKEGKDKSKTTSDKISSNVENFPKTEVKHHDKNSKSGSKKDKSSTESNELPSVKNNKQSEGGFTSSDFSFADCLNFGNVVPTKKKKPSKSTSSPSKPVEKHSKEKTHSKHKHSHSPVKEKREKKVKSSSELPAKKSSYSPSEPESLSDEENDIKKHLEEFASNPTLEYTLPQIQPNYKPLPQRPNYDYDFNYDFMCNKKKVLTNEDAIKFTSSRREKTAVYSGRRNGLSEVPTLIEACVNILIENIDFIEYIGSIPYDLLKPVFLRATPKQLHRIEFYNPDLLDESQELWEAHCKRDFRKQVRQEDETWRDMYWRETDERQNKLRSITANISASMSKSGPARKVKLAYLDSAVKPPRDVARRQAKNGTAAKVIHSAVAKTSTPKTIPSPLTNTRESLSVPSTSKAVAEFVPKYAKPKVAPLMAKTLKSIKLFTRRR